MLMSLVRREPNYLELEEMAQLAVNSAYRQQFANFYLPKPVEKSPLPKVEEVQDTATAPVALSEEEQRLLALEQEAMDLRYKGHEAELARRALVAQEEAERLAHEAQLLADLEAGVEDEGDEELKKMRENMKKQKKKPAIPAELLAGNSYEDKLMVVRFVAEQEQNRVANTIRSMIQITP
jgi:hypothetical protein